MENNYCYAVINPDGTFAGVPCLSYEEARELAYASGVEGRKIYKLELEDEDCDPATIEFEPGRTYWDEMAANP